MPHVDGTMMNMHAIAKAAISLIIFFVMQPTQREKNYVQMEHSSKQQ